MHLSIRQLPICHPSSCPSIRWISIPAHPSSSQPASQPLSFKHKLSVDLSHELRGRRDLGEGWRKVKEKGKQRFLLCVKGRAEKTIRQWESSTILQMDSKPPPWKALWNEILAFIQTSSPSTDVYPSSALETLPWSLFYRISTIPTIVLGPHMQLAS